ncbi:gamma-glutamylcyclotransferase [Lujinxingia litoralis]|uniref:glutathione-specific gamma-glutamylcyclotransferase n=1 Tax=Lujinxingia litoralis TaxID=2211119 RepID=A0A328C239_9DELT|nr:gamma-glutamylcyclotransferase [Lujinxingia litoralis]RAL20493.1 gamma-glutamylcyclotransferase [Lujinxingia litoralis]
MWIFGYGSLIWRPNFDYQARLCGEIRGYTRVFYQGSPDHRGVPEAPGRVVTLLPEPTAATFGVAFQLAPDQAERTLHQLDLREQGGYQRRLLPVFAPGHDTPLLDEALVYMATAENPHFLGAASPEAIAHQVALSHGPSGPNTEYVLRLAEALRAEGADDAHVFAVERALRALLSPP